MNNTNLICFKQGNKENEWWLCTKNEIEHIQILINTIIKKPDKNHKIQFLNNKDELVYIEGNITSPINNKLKNSGDRNCSHFLYKNSRPKLLSNIDNIEHRKCSNISLDNFNIFYYKNTNKYIKRCILIINLPFHNGIPLDDGLLSNNNSCSDLSEHNLINKKSIPKRQTITRK